jgi:16S rRNA (cytosine967-C5)-methyltransferase
MSLRVNVTRSDPQAYADLLATAGMNASPGWLPENLVLDNPVPSRSLPGYGEGLVSVQDAGAMFAARLLTEAAPAGPILDACAAPGGKLFHLAEYAPEADLTGLELSPGRFEFMAEEAARLGHHSIKLRQGDARLTDWHDGLLFAAILLDAPCSGSGTLRRHPDIKILRQPADLVDYAALQLELLRNLWQLLQPGGTLLYCTCSLFVEENDQVIEAFLAETADAQSAPFELPPGQMTDYGWQLVPLPADGQANRTVDGFYFARLTRLVTR